MTKHITSILLIIALSSCGLNSKSDKKNSIKPHEVKINWTENLSGNFSFTKNWDYPEGIYKNEFGQVSCDGLCPPEADNMKDENGKIFEDSLTQFYKLIDTSHLFHSIESDAWTYEWAGTNFVTVTKQNANKTICYTYNNIATHSSLILDITKDMCIPTIKVNSIQSSTTKTYNCIGGEIEIDKSLWNKGVLKANFDFTFDHTENPDKPMYWKGKIYANIDSK